jgi:hypothetical protein
MDLCKLLGIDIDRITMRVALDLESADDEEESSICRRKRTVSDESFRGKSSSGSI